MWHKLLKSWCIETLKECESDNFPLHLISAWMALSTSFNFVVIVIWSIYTIAVQFSHRCWWWLGRKARWHEMKFTFSLIVIESSRDALRFSRAETTTQLQTMEVWRLHIIFSLHFLLTLSLSPFAISAAVQWIFLLAHFHPPHHALLSFHHMAFSGRRVKETTVERLANLFTFFHPPLILFPMPFDGSSNSSNRFVFFHPLPSSAHHSRQWRCSKWEKQQERAAATRWTWISSSSSLACQLGFAGEMSFIIMSSNPTRAPLQISFPWLYDIFHHPFAMLARVVGAVHFVSSVDIACQNNGCFCLNPTAQLESTTIPSSFSLFFIASLQSNS